MCRIDCSPGVWACADIYYRVEEGPFQYIDGASSRCSHVLEFSPHSNEVLHLWPWHCYGLAHPFPLLCTLNTDRRVEGGVLLSGENMKTLQIYWQSKHLRICFKGTPAIRFVQRDSFWWKARRKSAEGWNNHCFYLVSVVFILKQRCHFCLSWTE